MAEVKKESKRHYDPVKAHEYYMKHRKLKGRKSGRKTSKKLSKEQKAKEKELSKDIDQRTEAFNDLVDNKIKEIISEAMKGGTPLTEEQIDGLRKNAEKVKEQGAQFYDKMYNKKLKDIEKG